MCKTASQLVQWCGKVLFGEIKLNIKSPKLWWLWHRYTGNSQQFWLQYTLDDSERGRMKGWLKIQHSEIQDHGIWFHHFMANRWGNNGNSDRLFLGSKITADVDCSLESKRRLLLGRKAMTKLDSILKTRDITLSTKVPLVKAMVFPVVMYGCESCTTKKAENWRIYAFELWCWRRLLRVPWTAMRSKQPILKEISPEYSLKDWCWSWNSNTLATW